MSELFRQSPAVENITPAPKPRPAAEVPPPPNITEQVTVRTLASDLELMGKGSRPTVQNAPVFEVSARIAGEAPKTSWVWLAVGGVGVLVFFFLGYFFLPILLDSLKKAPKPVPAMPAPSQPAALPTSTPSQAVSFAHRSFFRAPAEKNLEINLSGSPATYVQLLQQALSREGQVSFFEISLKDGTGSSPSWTRFSKLIAAELLPEEFWRSNFEPDFTLFAYKDKNGSWPGYILKLGPAGSKIVLQSQLLNIESASSSLKNLFLEPPAGKGSFADIQISGQPVRELKLDKTSLVYGWAFDKYLVISTSMEGYKQALSRL